jgi:hypothetical protein
MEQGMSSGEAIARVAQEIREKHQGDRVTTLFDDEEEEPQEEPTEYLEDDENY